MKLFNLIIALLALLFIGCDDSLNGPVGSNLNYEPQVISVGESADFGTIGKDIVQLKLVGVAGDSYQLEHSDKVCGYCPLNANDDRMNLTMCNGKYEVVFIATSINNSNLVLQLHHYQSLH